MAVRNPLCHSGCCAIWLATSAKLSVPKVTITSPPAGDSGAVAEIARLLVAAENPVLVTDRVARTPAGLAGLIELAETLQAPVVDRNGRMNFPTRHPLNQHPGSLRGQALEHHPGGLLVHVIAEAVGGHTSRQDLRTVSAPNGELAKPAQRRTQCVDDAASLRRNSGRDEHHATDASAQKVRDCRERDTGDRVAHKYDLFVPLSLDVLYHGSREIRDQQRR